MRTILFGGVALFGLLGSAEAAELQESLLFHASFDSFYDADVARGDARLYSAGSLQQENTQAGIDGNNVVWDRTGGRSGGALHFVRKHDKFVFFKGRDNVPGTKPGFAGTVSFWMRLTNKDLPPGYVDPLQITDKKWNDAAFFVDFTDKNPRQFRLGVFSDYKFWNPADRKWDDIAESERPMVNITEPPFKRNKWTHVAFVFERFNEPRQDGRAELYLDGKSAGFVHGRQQFHWQEDKVAIWLGINYVGWLDDLMVFDRALSPQEIQHLGESQ